ncbi:hydroxyisourate hydrolase [Rouxiella badensis]|jgi:5-hydroxyisourate hydrolase|uniref:hydroxyisourate hydrolase n=1 Tax=Rouxiella badensis TaxID=1646377 RepID=UPI0017889100|nr:hydroxyisourate hydrolase [Rouxiella badensis]MCC3703946.1 hydroxyisourate hydrolase [Rouxiella badensis]MCC3748520.1 hydroxyisourate hydrolase [Rouxiella badensis]QOI56189.1 hydroxyisourate hydrolase [Rouxiella badensis subsp. acadiensis]
MTKITTHILDTSLGKPAANVRVWLEKIDGQQALKINETATDADGRAAGLTPEGVEAGNYRLYADVGAYFSANGRETLYNLAIVDVIISAEQAHYHLPILLSPYSYSTYRGS